MSPKKLSRTPSNKKKSKQKNGKKSPHSSKTIDSFFRPLSNQSLCRANKKMYDDNAAPETSNNSLIISPSPQRKVNNEKTASEVRRKSPRLKLKKKMFINRIITDSCISIISSDSDEHAEGSDVKSTVPNSSINLEKNLAEADEEGDPSITTDFTSSDDCILKGACPENVVLNEKSKDTSKKLKLKKQKRACKRDLSNSLGVVNENSTVDGCSDDQAELSFIYQGKRKFASSSAADEEAVINKKHQIDNSPDLEIVESKGDICDINLGDSFEGVDFDGAMTIKMDDETNVISNDIKLNDSFLDVDLDTLNDNIEEVNYVLLIWKVIEISVLSVHTGHSVTEKVLTLKSDDKDTDAVCHLRDDWYFMEISIDDKVYVSGLSIVNTLCVLDNCSKNYLVIYPNTLISGTTLAAGITCERKAVLNERFKMDLSTNKAVFLGSLTHELFDWVLQHKDCTLDDIEATARENLKNPKYIEQLSILNLDVAGIIDMQREYYLSLETWSKQFMRTNNGTEIDFKIGQEKGTDSLTYVHVNRVVDIEENVWSPYYGLKGKIDATVEVTIHRKPKLSNKKKYLLPLEFKTGKLLSDLGSIDHRAQVAVYTMLLSERYNSPIDTGLLLYGKTNHMIGVPRPEQEKRAILIKRNEIARNLSLERKQITLPPLIQKKRICKRCDQNGTCMLYFKAVENGDETSSGVDELFTELTSHLNPNDLEYFAKWYELSILEASYGFKGSGDNKYIWKKSAEQRENDGICFSGMTSIHFCSDSDNKFIYKFRRSKNHFNYDSSLKSVPLGVGERVIISEQNVKVFNISTGYITDVTSDILSVSTHHKVKTISENKGTIYRIDKDDTLSNYSTGLNNLSRIFKVNSDTDSKLRHLIIGGVEPQFSIKDDQMIESRMFLDKIAALNSVQKLSIERCLSANDYVIIHGMPGTGKSTTIASLVQTLVSNGKSVLLTSYTHSAVDTILLKLLKVSFTDFVRIGQASRVHPTIHPFAFQEKTKSFKDVLEYKKFHREQKVVATTCLGINHPIFLTRRFDYCIVDEASQITQPVCIGPIRYANVFILVGDHNQLPPLVISPEAKEKGLDCSLFQTLSESHSNAVVTLNYQYRMNSSIMSLTNSLIYENRMKCANDSVADSLLLLPKFTELHKEGDAVQFWDIVNPKSPVVFINTDEAALTEEKSGSFIVNRGEAIIVKRIIKMLIQCGLPHEGIGVISMYRHQVNIIRDEIGEFGKSIEVDTMDKYQGKDKDCIIISFVRSNSTSEVGHLLKDWRRINVAMTRAKTKLIMIGSKTTIVNSEILCKLVDLVDSKDWCVNLEKSSIL